ncbi:MAG: DUF5318 domain-containing protein [Propionibacteriaceae bacterium]|jgi:hypothetical protein|nr:DUF5318 domain-containing protein [Propionibacteriaceae bacterium]
MWSKRDEVDYALQRRHTLQSVFGRSRTKTPSDICDADPMLIRAAYHHGEETSRACPVCDTPRLVTLNYVFGDQLGQYSGRIRSSEELKQMQEEYGEFKVCVVEVCVECSWNHIVSTYVLGDGVRRRPPRRQQTMEDVYG